QLEPAETAPAGRVAALRILHHQALVVALPSSVKDPVQLGGVEGADQVGEHKGGGEVELLEQPAPLAQRFGQQVAPVQVEHIEGDEDDRDLGEQGRADDLATKPVLEFEEGEYDSVLVREQLTVQQHVMRDRSGRGHDFGKGGGHLIEVARVDDDP